MKIKILSLFLLIASITYSQNLEQLKIDSEKIYEATYNLDFETVLNYSHPKLFETISREQMIIVLEQFHENALMRARLVYPKVNFSFSELQIIDGKTYCVIRYNNAMRTTFEKQLSPKDVESMKKGMQSVKENTKVTYEKSRNSFLVESKANLVAIADATSNNEWKFVNCSTPLAHLAKIILGDDVIAKLGLQLAN